MYETQKRAMLYEVCDKDSHITWPYKIADHHCRITWVYDKVNYISLRRLLRIMTKNTSNAMF